MAETRAVNKHLKGEPGPGGRDKEPGPCKGKAEIRVELTKDS